MNLKTNQGQPKSALSVRINIWGGCHEIFVATWFWKKCIGIFVILVLGFGILSLGIFEFFHVVYYVSRLWVALSRTVEHPKRHPIERRMKILNYFPCYLTPLLFIPGFPFQVDHSLTIVWRHNNHTRFRIWSAMISQEITYSPVCDQPGVIHLYDPDYGQPEFMKSPDYGQTVIKNGPDNG